MILKRLFDFLFAASGLLALLPLFVIIAIVIKLDSKGPVFFRQERIGRFGVPFRIHKFRTMSVNSEAKGLQLTTGGDSRITQAGQWLRKYKLDELAQLIDVLLGKMSLVGPRPEVPRYVALYPEQAKKVILSVRPGITDLASIEFKDENEILTASKNPETDYIDKILPVKMSYYQKYVLERSLWFDLVVIFKTLRAIVK